MWKFWSHTNIDDAIWHQQKVFFPEKFHYEQKQQKNVYALI